MGLIKKMDLCPELKQWQRMQELNLMQRGYRKLKMLESEEGEEDDFFIITRLAFLEFGC